MTCGKKVGYTERGTRTRKRNIFGCRNSKKKLPMFANFVTCEKKPDIGSKVQGNGTFFGCRNFKVHLFSIGCLSGEKVAGIADKENG